MPGLVAELLACFAVPDLREAGFAVDGGDPGGGGLPPKALSLTPTWLPQRLVNRSFLQKADTVNPWQNIMNLAEARQRAATWDGPAGLWPLASDRAGPGSLRPRLPDERRSNGAPAAGTIAANLSLLDRASKNVVSLLGRYHRLQEHVRQLDAWTSAQIQAAEAAAAHSRESAAEAEARLLTLQTAFDAMRRRAETAEQALERDGRTLETLQDRIIAAFGFGSEPHERAASVRMA